MKSTQWNTLRKLRKCLIITAQPQNSYISETSRCPVRKHKPVWIYFTLSFKLNKGTGPHANRCLHLRTSGVLCIGSFQSQNSAKECPGANSDLDLGGDPQDTIHHLNRNMPRYYRECIQVNGGHRLLQSHLLTYSGANSYYIPCWICKFVYLQRNELCIILKERKITAN